MEELPVPMNKDMLTFDEMNLAMPPLFRPVQRLRYALYEEAYPFVLRRLSAFPIFATSQEELMDLLAGVAGKERDIEGRFAALCKGIALETRCYQIQRRFAPRDDHYQALGVRAIDANFIEGLCEGDSIDILLPDLPLALVGHDDFGCNILAVPGDTQALEWFGSRAKAAGLHVLEPPSR
jgi:hypothetical protein